MVGLRLSRRARRFLKKIQRAPGKYELQEAASTIQAELDKRLISYDEALTLGNIIQHQQISLLMMTPLSMQFQTVMHIAEHWSCICGMRYSAKLSNYCCGKSAVASASATATMSVC